jgi:hypothetical protein
MTAGAIGHRHRTPHFSTATEKPGPPSDKEPEMAGRSHRTHADRHRTPKPSDTTGGVIYPQSGRAPSNTTESEAQ